jgi:hypothetical protein
MKPQIVVVHWLDAIGDRNDRMDDETNEKLRAVHCVSIGVLIERTQGKRGHIKLASELIEGGEYQEIQVIPNGMVLKLSRIPLPALPPELGKWTLSKRPKLK